MKKVALFFMMMIFAVSLAACNKSNDDIVDCLTNPDGEGCPVVCPAGQELDVDTATCVDIEDEELVCPTGQHVENDVCVITDTRTPQQIITDFIVNGFDSDESMEFLSTTMALMDFSSAMTVTTDISFSVTEDVDESHYFEGQLIDSYIVDETNGNMMQRQVIVDVDDELNLDFTVIYHEVEDGVHVYVNIQSLLDALTEENPDATEMLGWVGFTQPWAVFEFDDSLDAVIEVEVLKDMVVEMFFSEMGEGYFDITQADMEEDFGFDLNQYGVDLGLLMDTLIEEDFEGAQTMIDAIDFDGIMLHYDALNIAPNLYRLLSDTENGLVGELGLAGMATVKINMLDTANHIDYVPDDPYTPLDDSVQAHWELYGALVDPAKGTQAFLESLDADDYDAIVEVLVEPALLDMVENEIENAIRYDLSDQEVIDWLIDHNDALVAMGYDQDDINTWKIDIAADGGIVWYNSLAEDVLDLAIEQEVFERIDDFLLAVDDEEAAEWLVAEVFSNPHATQALLDLGIEQVVIDDVIAANFMSVDFDALVLETVDLEALVDAVMDGSVAYDAYLDALEISAPNHAAILEVFAPGVASLEPHMAYIDDVQYAFDGLEIFEDYTDLTYYMDDIFDVEVSATEDFDILTEFEVDGIALATLFDDLTIDLGIYLDGFTLIEDYPYDEEWVCLDPLDEDCEEPDFDSVVAELTTLDSITGYLLMDPMSPTGFELGLDFTDLADGIVSDEYAMISDELGYTPHNDNDDITGVTDMSITITVEDAATITLPLASATTDVNMVVQDVAKYAMTMKAYEYLEEVADYYLYDNPSALYPLYNTNVYLEDIPQVDFSLAFDLEMSYVTVNVALGGMGVPNPATLDYEIVLYWLDGTPVFTNPVGLAEVVALMLDGDLVSQTAYQTMVDKVEDDNWHTSKLFLVYLVEDNSYQMMPQ